MANISTTSTQTMPISHRVHHSRIRPGFSTNVIYTTRHHVVEQFGPQMPVAVAEDLRYTPAAKEHCSVNINSDIGWAWYVVGRRILAWHILSPSYTNEPVPVRAKDLLLPPCDLPYHANLVQIFSGDDQVGPSCVGVSPEGVVRYWALIGQAFIDVNANLGGEVVCGVQNIPPLGCLAFTTSGSMFIIIPIIGCSSPTIKIKKITPSFGWLSNFGRTVSTMIFGPTPAEKPEVEIVKVLTSLKVKEFWNVMVVAGMTIQSWLIEIENTMAEMSYRTNVDSLIHRAFPENLIDENTKIYITDVALTEAGIVALVASESPRCYIIVELNADDLNPPTSATRMCIIAQNSINYLENLVGDVAALHFALLPTSALVFNKKIIFAMPLCGGDEVEGEPLEIPGDVVHGGLMYKKTPLFFSIALGFVSISPVNTSYIDVLNTSIVETSSLPTIITEEEPITLTNIDFIEYLKLAFIHYIRQNYNQCFNVIKEHFPFSEKDCVDCILSTTIVKMSLGIINDFSLKGYNKMEVRQGLKLSESMFLYLDTQLMEKAQAHDLFLKFAKAIASVMNLGKITRRGNAVGTIHILYEHNDKVTTAFILKKLCKIYQRTILDAVVNVARDLNSGNNCKINEIEFFFHYASISDEAIKCLINICIEKVSTVGSSLRHLKLLTETTAIVNSILKAIIHKKLTTGYYIDRSYLPWLVAPTPGLFDSLLALAKLNFDLITGLGDECFRSKRILKQYFYYSNYILFLRMPYTSKSDFDNLSSAFIQLFIELKMPYEALQLAYKYKNFNDLISLTYQLNMDSEIKNYIDAFADDGFCSYLYKYLCSVGRYTDLLNMKLPKKNQLELKEHISHLPVVKWLYCLKLNDLSSSYDILLSLINNESVNIFDQEIIYIYTKIISETAGFKGTGVDVKLKTICLQKQVISALCMSKGSIPGDVKLMNAEDIIEIILEDAAKMEKTDYLFSKALELLSLIQSSAVFESARRKIWSTVVSYDCWDKCGINFNSESFDDFLTFRLMKMVKFKSNKVQLSVVPKINDILSEPGFDVFNNNALYKSVYEYAYEQIIRS